MIQDALDGKSLSRDPRFHAKGIPSYRGAVELARVYGIERRPDIQISTSLRDAYLNPHRVFHVVCKVRFCKRSVCGAAEHPDAYIAMERAYQNAVRQILFFDHLK